MLNVANTVDHMVGTVRDVMTERVVTAKAYATVAEVATQLAEENLRRIVVVDREQRPLGVVSQRDILRHFLTNESDESAPPGATEVQALIHRERPITVAPNVPLIKAALVLAANKIGCLPVVDDEDHLVGVLTTTDLLRHITGYVGGSVEAAFQIYTPTTAAQARMPAYIRQKTGDLVIPLCCISHVDNTTNFVLLGYDPPSGRILVKFVDEYNASAGVLRAKRDQEYLVIPASAFVAHFDLTGRTTPFDVSDHHDGRYLVLSPR